jgi:hypothetical protein
MEHFQGLWRRHRWEELTHAQLVGGLPRHLVNQPKKNKETLLENREKT